MPFQKPHFKATASTCRFRFSIHYYCAIAIISALRKPRNFPECCSSRNSLPCSRGKLFSAAGFCPRRARLRRGAAGRAAGPGGEAAASAGPDPPRRPSPAALVPGIAHRVHSFRCHTSPPALGRIPAVSEAA